MLVSGTNNTRAIVILLQIYSKTTVEFQGYSDDCFVASLIPGPLSL